jgi:hypothetical protein
MRYSSVNRGGAQNLILKDVNISVTQSNVGALTTDVEILGYAGMPSPLRNIHNIIITGSITSTGSNVGGLAGLYKTRGNITPGTIKLDKIYNQASIAGSTQVGGLIGQAFLTYNAAYSFDVTMENCKNTGSVSGTGGIIGGLIGWLNLTTLISGSTMRLRKCIATGNVSGTDYVAGLVAYVTGDGSKPTYVYINDCVVLMTSITRISGTGTHFSRGIGYASMGSGGTYVLADNYALDTMEFVT